MTFDWPQFLRQRGIEHRLSGPNVHKGWCGLCCPFCGDDRGFHLGINLTSGVFSCWRNRDHRGGTVYLLQVLTGCSAADARDMAGGGEPEPGPETWEALERQAAGLDRAGAAAAPRLCRFPPEFLPIRPVGPTGACFDYLTAARGFHERDVPALCRAYGLHVALAGPWKRRLILPYLSGRDAARVWGWQARALGPSRLRYLTHPPGDALKRLLFNGAAAEAGGDVLAIVEGPLDALKVDFYGQTTGIRAVACAGIAYTAAQLAALHRLAPRYRQVLILFDAGAEETALDLQAHLAPFAAQVGFVTTAEDAGALPPDAVVPCVRDSLA